MAINRKRKCMHDEMSYALNNVSNFFQMFFIIAAFDNLCVSTENPIISYFFQSVSIYLMEEIPKTCDIKGHCVFSSFNKYQKRLESINNSTGVDSYKIDTKILMISPGHEIPLRMLCPKDSSYENYLRFCG